MKNKSQDSGANAVGHKSVISAVITGLVDLFNNKGQIGPLDPELRIDGKTCLVTGANSGLGKAIAIQLAQKGGKVIMACRPGHRQALQDIKKLSGSDKISLMEVDLSDLVSVHKFCDQLKQQKIKLDIAVLNAGLMPLNARKSAQGFELMFAVHFLANRLLLKRWLEDEVLPIKPDAPSRVILVSSEAHQSSDAIDFDRFGEFKHYGMKEGMKHYGLSKLHLTTLAQELSRRVNPSSQINVAIHALCPGPINSNIARESPAYIKPLLSPIMKWLFRSPEKAAEPVIYLACAQEMEQRSGAYLHMMKEKAVSPHASNIENGEKLWQLSEQLLITHQPETQQQEQQQGEVACP